MNPKIYDFSSFMNVEKSKPDLTKRTFSQLTHLTPKERPKLNPVDRESEDIKTLLDIHSYMRVDQSETEYDFIEKYILTIPGIHKDEMENYYVRIGEDSKVLWSAHIDTVHRMEGRQKIAITKDDLLVIDHKNEKHSNCLGADDGAGMFILFELIKAEIPGLYIFHRNEEHGSTGSKYIASNQGKYNLLHDIDYAIAFDRKGYSSIITHQMYENTASENFAESFREILKINSLYPDDTGIFTDTANYCYDVSECTNISVGYFNEHGPSECLDLRFLIHLKNQIIENWDESQLVKHRDKNTFFYDIYAGNSNYDSDFDFDKKSCDFCTKIDEIHDVDGIYMCKQCVEDCSYVFQCYYCGEIYPKGNEIKMKDSLNCLCTFCDDYIRNCDPDMKLY